MILFQIFFTQKGMFSYRPIIIFIYFDYFTGLNKMNLLGFNIFYYFKEIKKYIQTFLDDECKI